MEWRKCILIPSLPYLAGKASQAHMFPHLWKLYYRHADSMEALMVSVVGLKHASSKRIWCPLATSYVCNFLILKNGCLEVGCHNELLAQRQPELFWITGLTFWFDQLWHGLKYWFVSAKIYTCRKKGKVDWRFDLWAMLLIFQATQWIRLHMPNKDASYCIDLPRTSLILYATFRSCWVGRAIQKAYRMFISRSIN